MPVRPTFGREPCYALRNGNLCNMCSQVSRTQTDTNQTRLLNTPREQTTTRHKYTRTHTHAPTGTERTNSRAERSTSLGRRTRYIRNWTEIQRRSDRLASCARKPYRVRSFRSRGSPALYFDLAHSLSPLFRSRFCQPSVLKTDASAPVRPCTVLT